MAKNLPYSIPEKSTTRSWRSYFTRFNAIVRNYSHYQLSGQSELVDNIPPLELCKSQLEIMTDAKYFLDKLEINSPTSHLSFLSYLTLDIKLYRKQVGIDEIFSLSNKTAGQLRESMRNKVWPYSGSYFSKTAAFFTGIDFYAKIRELMSFVENDAILLDVNTTLFKQGWLNEACSMDYVAENEVKLMVNTLPFELNENSFCSDSASRLRKIPPKNDLLIGYLNPIVSGCDITIDNQISSEIERYKSQRNPTVDLQYFWKNADYFPFIRRGGKDLFECTCLFYGG